MNQQDFIQQGEGREEDKLTAWNLFQQAYECQMNGKLDDAVKLYQNSIDRLSDGRSLYLPRVDLQLHGPIG